MNKSADIVQLILEGITDIVNQKVEQFARANPTVSQNEIRFKLNNFLKIKGAFNNATYAPLGFGPFADIQKIDSLATLNRVLDAFEKRVSLNQTSDGGLPGMEKLLVHRDGGLYVYRANNQEESVALTRFQKGDYKWCIGYTGGGNRWNLYRIQHKYTVYFVFNSEKEATDRFYYYVLMPDYRGTLYKLVSSDNGYEDMDNKDYNWNAIVSARPELDGLKVVFKVIPLNENEVEEADTEVEIFPSMNRDDFPFLPLWCDIQTDTDHQEDEDGGDRGQFIITINILGVLKDIGHAYFSRHRAHPSEKLIRFFCLMCLYEIYHFLNERGTLSEFDLIDDKYFETRKSTSGVLKGLMSGSGYGHEILLDIEEHFNHIHYLICHVQGTNEIARPEMLAITKKLLNDIFAIVNVYEEMDAPSMKEKVAEALGNGWIKEDEAKELLGFYQEKTKQPKNILMENNDDMAKIAYNILNNNKEIDVKNLNLSTPKPNKETMLDVAAKILLKEAPIIDYQKQGDWNSKRVDRYDRASVRMLNNPKTEDRLRAAFSKTDVKFNFVFAKGKTISETSDYGAASPERVKELLGIDVAPPQRDEITIIFTNNIGDQKMALSPWIVAHRIGHAIRRQALPHIGRDIDSALANNINYLYHTNFKERDFLLNNNRKAFLIRYLCGLGTFRSAREGKISRGFEFLYEVFAQYLITGSIKINSNPPKLLMKGMPLREEWNEADARYLEELFTYYWDATLNNSRGKIFIM